MFGSVRLSVCLRSNTVQDICVFGSNQGLFIIKSLTQRSITFNFSIGIEGFYV